MCIDKLYAQRFMLMRFHSLEFLWCGVRCRWVGYYSHLLGRKIWGFLRIAIAYYKWREDYNNSIAIVRSQRHYNLLHHCFGFTDLCFISSLGGCCGCIEFAFIRHGLKPVFCPYRQHSFSLNLPVSLTHMSVLMISESYLGRYAVSPAVQSCAGIWVPLKETY